MYFISRIYQSIKCLTAVSGTTGAIIAIVYGALMSGGTIFIVGGSLCLANSVFNLIEIGKINVDIKQQINELKMNLKLFSQENVSLHTNVISLNNIRDQFIKENKKLQDTIDEGIEHIGQLEKLKDEYDEINKKLSAQLEDNKDQIIEMTNENKTLKMNVEKIIQLHDKFSKENVTLKELLGQANEQISEITKIKIEYEEEMKKMYNNNEKMNEQIRKQNEIINESKKLIQSLAQFGDKYEQFSTSIDTNLIKIDNTNNNLDNTAKILKNLVNKLENQTFEQLDNNNDGLISQEEFSEGLQRL